jgi:hypothetical protein
VAGVLFPARETDIFSLHSVQTASGANKASYSMRTEVYSPKGVKQPEHKANLAPSSVDIPFTY